MRCNALCVLYPDAIEMTLVVDEIQAKDAGQREAEKGKWEERERQLRVNEVS